MPVYIVDPDGYQVNTELRNTDSTGKVEYCIPARVDITDDAGISLWSSCDETWSNSLIGGKILVNYKGFYHSTTIPADVASGITRTITVPNDSTATIYRLGALKANQAVYVANANLTQLLSNASIATNTSGQAAFAIPNGTQFRFYVEDTDGTASYSDALTAPNNGTIRMVVQNMPTLTAPANNTAFSTSSAASFSWSSVTNAADYVWYIRPSTQSNYSGYSMTANGINAQFGVGTWYWVVCARDSAGNVIAQSQIRSFTVSAAGTQSLASPLNAPDNAGASVTITSPNVSAVNSQPAAFADTSELSEQIGELEYETLYGEYEELLNLYFGL
ncbi:MAG: hypothetical protein LBT46_04800 [Planctomycetaceae bacterium]|nr:hypothetical protein [Planctomycetaceae bacterium]